MPSGGAVHEKMARSPGNTLDFFAGKPLRQAGGTLVATVLIVAAVEAALVPPADYSYNPLVFTQLMTYGISYTFILLYGPLVYGLAVAVLENASAVRPFPPVVKVGIHLALSCGVVLNGHRDLTEYDAFVGQWPFIAGSTVLCLVLFASLSTVFPLPWLIRHQRLWVLSRWFFVVFGLAGAGGVYLANVFYYKNLYPTLHWYASQISLLLLWSGLLRLRTQWGPPKRPSKKIRDLCWRLAVVFLVVALVATATGISRPARPLFIDHSLLGQVSVLFAPSPFEESSSASRERPFDANAELRFNYRNQLPALPQGFDLNEYNILFVLSEATRFDKTSLSDPALGTTPNLRKLVDRGALSFTRAFAPSSGTLHSLGSLLCMTYPSATHSETWKKSWHGQLNQKAHTVTEILSEAGYDTFWTGHDLSRAMTRTIGTGFHQGFKEVKLLRGKSQKTLDKRIAKKAIAMIDKRQKAQRKFFGMVFFGSPHSPHRARYPKMPKNSKAQRYLHELRYMDEQLGRLLTYLDDRDLLESTIVIYAGDHGEEFREHGGFYHKTTVYSESIRVPLVILIPGLKGQTIDRVTSLMYVFPWLLLRGAAPAREAALERLTLEIGPMLEATKGAVVVELIGHKRMLTSLIYRRFKINYNFISKLHELYDIIEDPLEQNNLARPGEPRTDKHISLMNEYRRIRSLTRHTSVKKNKKDPKKKRKKRKKRPR